MTSDTKFADGLFVDLLDKKYLCSTINLYAVRDSHSYTTTCWINRAWIVLRQFILILMGDRKVRFEKVVAIPLLILFVCVRADGALVLNEMVDYTNNFNHLAVTGSTNAWVNDQASESTSGSPGWYWQDGSASFTYEAGGPTSPRALSLGTAGDRTIGSYSATTNLHTAWGIVLQNNSGKAISQIEVSYNGEQYRRAENSSDMLHFSFLNSATEITDLMPTAGAVPSGWHEEVSLSFAAPLATGTPPFFELSETDYEETISSLVSVNVPDGHFLALRWYDGDVAGDDAALGIDDLTIRFTATAVPEPSAMLFGVVAISSLYGFAKLRNHLFATMPK